MTRVVYAFKGHLMSPRTEVNLGKPYPDPYWIK